MSVEAICFTHFCSVMSEEEFFRSPFITHRPVENRETYDKIIRLLKENHVEYEEIVHPPCKTSAEVRI